MEKIQRSNFVICSKCGKAIRVQSLCNSCVNTIRDPIEYNESLEEFVKDIIKNIK